MTDAQTTYLLSVLSALAFFVVLCSLSDGITRVLAIAGLGCLAVAVYSNHLYGMYEVTHAKTAQVPWTASGNIYGDMSVLMTYVAGLVGGVALLSTMVKAI